MNILILSPFKTGTTSLYATFYENNINVLKLHDIDHTFHTDYSHVFLLTRERKKLYLSAYFQDIDNPEFEYHYGTQEEVLNADISDIIKHYKKFNFEKYTHLDIKYYLNLLEKYFDVQIEDLKDEEKYNVALKNNTYFIFIRLENLSDVFEQVCLQTNLPENIKLQSHNSSQYKWYSDLYNRMTDILL